MNKAIAQETLATRVETGAAREFRVMRKGGLTSGTAVRQQVATDPLAA